MASTRLQMMLAALLLSGAPGACAVDDSTPSGDDVTAARSGGASHDAPSAPWSAAPGGATLEEYVVERARALAAAPYRGPDVRVTPTVADLTYGQYRGIRFLAEEAIWREDGPFQLQLFHPGAGNDTPVHVNVVEDGRSRTLLFDPARYAYGDEVEGLDLALPADAGHAGLRVLYPLNTPGHFDEVVSFLGASYFRLLGPGQVYGLSARGIAVGIGRAEPEEFPAFREFWVVRPDEGRTLTLHALLDGPSVAGAYRFELTPGDAEKGAPTVMAVDARIFARTDVVSLGIAPLTSMYLHGTFDRGGDDDFRPRVHDSEGLLMHTSRDEWIWRPLTNRTGVAITSLRDRDPVGFGLVQRDRDFANYLDLEAEYHRRPSLWVAPDDPWGLGGVALLEIPTTTEFNDNIVAFWSPAAPLEAGEERTYRYRLVTFDDRLGDGVLPDGDLVGERLGRVARTRIARDALPGVDRAEEAAARRVVVDFVGGPLEALGEGVSVEASLTTSSGRISDLLLHPLPEGGRRATFRLVPDDGRGADMRLYLHVAGRALTETWSYLWEPADGR